MRSTGNVFAYELSGEDGWAKGKAPLRRWLQDDLKADLDPDHRAIARYAGNLSGLDMEVDGGVLTQSGLGIG
jgi:hypothetical protein